MRVGKEPRQHVDKQQRSLPVAHASCTAGTVTKAAAAMSETAMSWPVRRLQTESNLAPWLDGRQWQHGDPPATDDDPVHMVQVRGGDYHVARWAYGLYALQDLDLDAVDHGEGPADGAHVATIPAGLVAHHGAAQPADQLGRGYVINQEIQVPGIDRQSMEGEGGASADSPPATSNNGQLAQGRTPRWC